MFYLPSRRLEEEVGGVSTLWFYPSALGENFSKRMEEEYRIGRKCTTHIVIN